MPLHSGQHAALLKRRAVARKIGCALVRQLDIRQSRILFRRAAVAFAEQSRRQRHCAVARHRRIAPIQKHTRAKQHRKARHSGAKAQPKRFSAPFFLRSRRNICRVDLLHFVQKLISSHMEYPSFSRYARSALRLRKSIVFTLLFVMEYRAAIAEISSQ